MAGIGRQRLRRTDLVGDDPFDLARRIRNAAAAEAGKIRKARMRADSDTILLGDAEDFGHHFGIATVKAAGDIGAGDDAEHGGIIAHFIGAETLAAIAIEIDALHDQPKFALYRIIAYEPGGRQEMRDPR